MNEQTISSNRYPLAGMFNGTVIALWGAFFLMLLLRGLPRFKNGLLDMDAHAFYGVTVGIGAAVFVGLVFRYYESAIQFFQRAYVSIKSIVLSVLPSGIISKETTHAAIVQKESKLDALMYFFWNDDPRWKDPYYFISQLIVELKKLEFQLHRYIVLERIAFACACRDRLEQLEIPHYFQYLVEDAKCGGECFVEHSLYPFVMQALSESATARTDYNELIRRVCRLFVTHNHHNLVFTDSSTAFELDEGQVIELESCFVTRNVLGKEGVSCRSL